ncbi:serine protease [Polaribacter atrinae]|uniref:S1 family peptidase n=1 Tax=Polaribacter atrinae TaxID=1333662 RepID=UPI0030FBD36D
MNIDNLHKVIYTVGRITPNGVTLLGTCFLLQENGCFATTAHVTNNDENNLVIVASQTTDLNNYQDTSNNQVNTFPAKIKSIDPVRDIAIIQTNNPINSNINIQGADNVAVGNTLAIVGYPHSNLGRQVLTYQRTIVGAKILIETSGIKSKHLVLNIQTRPGQSGSPVFNDANTELIGMIIGSYVPGQGEGISLGGVDPHTLHQTTHAVSSEYILKML